MGQRCSKETSFQEIINIIDLFSFSSSRKLTGSVFDPNGPVGKERELFSLNRSEKVCPDTPPASKTLSPCAENLLNGRAGSLNAVYYIGP